MMYKDQPADFKKEIDVVGCYIQCDGKILLLHRQAQKTNGNTWGMPAGKIDLGESISQAMEREIREETGLEIPESALTYFDSRYVRNQGHDLIYHMFSTKLDQSPEITLSPK